MHFFKRFFDVDDAAYFHSISRASIIGLHMVSGLLAGGLIGYGLDRWLGTKPWFTVIFFVAGIIAGFKNVYLDTKRLLRDQKKQDDRNAGKDSDKD